eukprot:s199_g10.t2
MSSLNRLGRPGLHVWQDAMVSVEAHIASKMQVDAVFGDLQVLRGHLVNALAKRKPSRSGTSAAVQDAVAAIYILVADVRRLLLEAAAFGTLLWQAEDKALELSSPTLTKQSRLSDFGVQADSDGNPGMHGLRHASSGAFGKVCNRNQIRTSLFAAPPGVANAGLHVPRVALLVLFIAVDSGQALVMDWAEKRSWMERAGRQYSRQTALVVESGLSVLTGLVLSLFLGADKLSAFWPLCIKFFPVALCFAVGLSLKMMAVNHFQAGTIKIVGQLRLGLVALASTIILSRRYSPQQWVAISGVTVFCMLFVQVKGQGRKREGKDVKWAGLSQLLGWVCMNVVGGTLAEKTYKSSDVPYYIQKIAQDMGHLATSLLMLFLVVPHFNPSEMETQSSQAGQTDADAPDEWNQGNEGHEKALLALRLNENVIMDFGPQNTLLQKITKEQLLAGKNKAILCVSRGDLKPFTMKIKDLYARIRFHEEEAMQMKALSLHKGYELEKSQKEIQGLKKQLASTTARATKAEAEAKASRRGALLADLHEPGFTVQNSPAYCLSLEESERLQMRVADTESLMLSSFESQDPDETIGTIMTIPSAIEQREDLAAAEQRKQSARSNRTMQKLLDTVHTELKEESARSQASRHEVRRARSEAAVLRALLQRAGSKEASEISQTSPSQEFVQMDVVKQHHTANMAGMQKMQERLHEEMEDCDALAVALEEVMEKSSQYQRRLEEKELELGQLRVEMEKTKVELAQHHQSQPILLQEKAALERQLQEVTQSEVQKHAQLEEAQALAQQTAAENELKLEEAKARAQQLEEEKLLTEEKYKELQADLQQSQPILLQEKAMLQQQIREAQELVQQTAAENAEKQAKARAQQLEEEKLLTEEKYKELQADLQQSQPILLQEKEMLQQQVREAQELVQQTAADNAEKQVELEEAKARAQQLEEEKLLTEKRSKELQADLQQSQPILLQEKEMLQQQVREAQELVQRTAAENTEKQVELEEAKARAQQLEEEKLLTEEKYKELQADLQQSQPILLQEKEMLQQQAQELQQQTAAENAEKQVELEEAKARAQQLEEEKLLTEEKYKELQAKARAQQLEEEKLQTEEKYKELQAQELQQQTAAENAEKQVELEEAKARAQQLEEEKLQTEEKYKELQADLQQSQPILLQEKEMLQQQVREAEKEKQQMLEDLKQQMQLEAQQYSASLQELARAEIARRDEQVQQKGKENADLAQQLQEVQASVNQLRQAEAAMQLQLQEASAFVRAAVNQFRQSEAAMKMQLQEASAYAQRLEEEKRRSEEHVNELKAMCLSASSYAQRLEEEKRRSEEHVNELKAMCLSASSYAQRLEEEKRRSEEHVNELKAVYLSVQLQQSQPVLEVSHDSPTGPASFDISTPRSHKSPWADSPEERRPDDAIVAENKQLHQRIAVVEEEKAIMMQNLRDHVMQLARENWDLKNRGFVEDSSGRSQSTKDCMEEIKALGRQLGLSPNEVSSCLRLGRALSECHWCIATDVGQGALEVAMDVFEAGRYMEYHCYDDHWNSQGRAVLRLAAWQDKSEGLFKADHGPASDAYYDWYVKNEALATLAKAKSPSAPGDTGVNAASRNVAGAAEKALAEGPHVQDKLADQERKKAEDKKAARSDRDRGRRGKRKGRRDEKKRDSSSSSSKSSEATVRCRPEPSRGARARPQDGTEEPETPGSRAKEEPGQQVGRLQQVGVEGRASREPQQEPSSHGKSPKEEPGSGSRQSAHEGHVHRPEEPPRQRRRRGKERSSTNQKSRFEARGTSASKGQQEPDQRRGQSAKSREEREVRSRDRKERSRERRRLEREDKREDPMESQTRKRKALEQEATKQIRKVRMRVESPFRDSSPTGHEAGRMEAQVQSLLRDWIVEHDPSGLSAAQMAFHLILQVWHSPSPFQRLMEWNLQAPEPREERVRNLFPLPLWHDDVEQLRVVITSGTFKDQTGQWRERAETRSKAQKAMRLEGLKAWHALAVLGLNYLYGDRAKETSPCPGSQATAAQEKALVRIWDMMKVFFDDKDKVGVPRTPLHEWENEIKDMSISYTGEVVEKAKWVTLRQILPGLPSPKHGGLVDILAVLPEDLADTMRHPERLLKTDWPEPMPRPRVMCEDKEWDLVVEALYQRGFVTPVDQFVQISGEHVLNGIFGVPKPGKTLPTGEDVLRLIVDLRASNWLMHQIDGDCQTLAASFQRIFVGEDQQLLVSGEDLVSAFYLFALPATWAKYMVLAKPVAGGAGLSALAEISRTAVFPLLEEGCAAWSIYLDDTSILEVVSGKAAQELAGRSPEEQTRLKQAYGWWGIPTNPEKALMRCKQAERLGALLDGPRGILRTTTKRCLELASLGSWVRKHSQVGRKALQVYAGKAVHILQFRRCLFASLEVIFRCIAHGGPEVPVSEELCTEMLVLEVLLPLTQCNLKAKIDPVVTASDACETGAGVCYASRLSRAGKEEAEKLLEGDPPEKGAAIGDPTKLNSEEKVLVIDLFAGLGGFTLALQKAGVEYHHLGVVEKDAACRRLMRRAHPGAQFFSDIEKFGKSEILSLVKKIPVITGIAVGGGSPCQGLSMLSSKRQHLKDERSKLFYEASRVFKDVEAVAAEMKLWVLKLLENVISDREDIREMNRELKMDALMVDSQYLSRARRPGLFWVSVVLSEEEDVERVEHRDYTQLIYRAEQEPLELFLTEGAEWEGGLRSEKLKFPTFTRAIVRKKPSPDPAGLGDTPDGARARWEGDQFRYRPYTYRDEYMILTPACELRPLNAQEREVLMGYQPGHCMRLLKKPPETPEEKRAAEDLQCSALGNSFHTNAVACLCRKGAREIVQSSMAQQITKVNISEPPLEEDPEATTTIDRDEDTISVRGATFAEDMERKSHSTKLLADELHDEMKLSSLVVAAYLRRQEYRGSDVRLDISAVYRPDSYPRGSVEPFRWIWHRFQRAGPHSHPRVTCSGAYF